MELKTVQLRMQFQTCLNSTNCFYFGHTLNMMSDSTHKNESTSITVASDNTATYNSRWQRRDSPVEHLFYWDSRRLGQFQRIRLQSACKGQTCWRVGIMTSVTRRVPPTPSMKTLHKQMPVFPQHMASIGGPPPPLPPPPPLLLCLQLRRGRRKKKQAGDSQQTWLWNQRLADKLSWQCPLIMSGLPEEDDYMLFSTCAKRLACKFSLHKLFTA